MSLLQLEMAKLIILPQLLVASQRLALSTVLGEASWESSGRVCELFLDSSRCLGIIMRVLGFSSRETGLTQWCLLLLLPWQVSTWGRRNSTIFGAAWVLLVLAICAQFSPWFLVQGRGRRSPEDVSGRKSAGWWLDQEQDGSVLQELFRPRPPLCF